MNIKQVFKIKVQTEVFFFNKHYFKYYFGSKNMILVQTIPNDTKLVSQRK